MYQKKRKEKKEEKIIKQNNEKIKLIIKKILYTLYKYNFTIWCKHANYKNSGKNTVIIKNTNKEIKILRCSNFNLKQQHISINIMQPCKCKTQKMSWLLQPIKELVSASSWKISYMYFKFNVWIITNNLKQPRHLLFI